MTNKELKEEITHLKTALAELEEKVEALPNRVDGGVFKPEDGQKHWSITSVGDVAEGLWNYNPFNHERYAIGNCFPTKQAAVDAIRVLKLIQKARESQGGFVPDWDDEGQDKFSLSLDGMGIGTSTYISLNVASIFGYWEDESTCEQFVQDYHNELLWFFTEYHR